ncbi:family 78 glycoside hydrolase catalytic domain [Streptomyces sp. NPDC051172]|uniref:family 78 glycoside hydrolase catalytic domain n=1 Tax=Streptomyces sp. NPDC051172 TaxID=3155796 RepID=UPI00343D39F1
MPAASRPARAPASSCGAPARRRPETWEPHFTLHGFRYAEITGRRGGFPGLDIVAHAHHTGMTRTGWFDCSNEQVSRLHENVGLWRSGPRRRRTCRG